MTINHVLPGQIRATVVRNSGGEEDAKARKDPGDAAPRGRADSVEISPEGRVLSSREPEGLEGATGLSPEQFEEIARRMGDGTYDTPEVAEEVARRMLSSGDLEP